jgi:hypothetical protein
MSLNGEPGKRHFVESVCNHPLMEGVVTLMAENIKNHFFPEAERSAVVYNKATEALYDFSREIVESIEKIRDLPPIDTSKPDWVKQVAPQLEQVLAAAGFGFPGEEKSSTPLLFDKLTARFNDIGPERWVEGANENKLDMITIRMLEFAGTVAYLTRLGINPNRLREN